MFTAGAYSTLALVLLYISYECIYEIMNVFDRLIKTQPQLQLSWAELTLNIRNELSHPPPTKDSSLQFK